jgi:hypothetical protein
MNLNKIIINENSKNNFLIYSVIIYYIMDLKFESDQAIIIKII